MKKMRIENGNLIAYIQYQDVTTLTSIKDFVRGEIFREESILKGECDDEGYYRIANLANVHYIKGLSFIPNYDYLLKLDFNQVSTYAQVAIEDYRSVNEILTRLCNQTTPLNEQEISFLTKLDTIDQSLVKQLLIDGQLRDVTFRSIANCLTIQTESYMHAVMSVAEEKKARFEEEQLEKIQEDKSKAFSLRRIWQGYTNKRQGE